MSDRSKTDTDLIKVDNPIVEYIGRFVTWDRKKSKPAKGDMWAPCPFHGEKSPSFHVVDKPGGGFYKCFGCGASGDVIRFAQEHHGMTFPQAIAALGGSQVDLTPEQKRDYALKKAEAERQAEQRVIEDQQDEQVRVNRVLQIWNECVPMAGTLAQTYAECRGIPAFEFPRSLRFHGNLFCEIDGKKHPCLVAALTRNDRKIRSIWRIFLKPDGTNLIIDGQKVKRGFGPSAGACCRLTPVGSDWNIGEGLESTLGAMFLHGQVGSWAATLSTSGMSGLDIPAEPKFVRIWADGDRHRIHKETGKLMPPPGLKAARQLAERLHQSGKKSIIEQPPERADWLDVWNAQGRNA